MLGAQAAREQDRRASKAAADHRQSGEGLSLIAENARIDQGLRIRSLELAQTAAQTGIIANDQVLATAGAYLAYIKGANHG